MEILMNMESKTSRNDDFSDFVYASSMDQLTRANAGEFSGYRYIAWQLDPVKAIGGSEDRGKLHEEMTELYGDSVGAEWTTRDYGAPAE